MPSHEDRQERYVYGIQSGRFIKIGVAIDVASRLHVIKLSNPHDPKVIYYRKTAAAYHCEKKMHEVLRVKAVGREWFEVTVEDVRAAGRIGMAYARSIIKRTREQYYFSVTPVTQPIKTINNNNGVDE